MDGEKYTLLTMTECMEDYLLTGPELKELPFWNKVNSGKGKYGKMYLYMKTTVEKFAFEKWGGEDGLDGEFEKRLIEKKRVKDKKFVEKMGELRKKTRTSTAIKKRIVHEHSYGEKVMDKKTEMWSQECLECGMQIEFDEF